MLDSSLKISVTDDPDPLPEGFYHDPARKCEFFHEERTDGLKGLAFAVVLRALEDGVCEQWLRLLSRFYEIEIPERFMVRTPQRRLRMSIYTKRMTTVTCKLVLTWFDVPPIQRKHLTRVA